MHRGSTSTCKVLAILEGYNWPSGIVRARIYKELMARDGFDVEFIGRVATSVADLVDPVPWQRARFAAIGAGTLVNNVRILAKAGSADVIYLSKVTSYRFLKQLRRRTRARIVLDFGDAMWLDAKDRRIDGEFRAVLNIVDAVTVDNDFTASYVRKLGKACTVIPDSPQLELFDRKRPETTKNRNGQIVVGWIGTPGSFSNIELIADALREVSHRHSQMVLRLVGMGRELDLLRVLEGIPYTVRPSYNQDSMIDEVFGMDIGLFPLKDDERSLVRGVLKATVYMCGETPVIASPIGQVSDVIVDGMNGMLASTTDEWITKLDALVSDGKLRQRVASEGLETVRNRFRTHQSWELLRAVLRGEAA